MQYKLAEDMLFGSYPLPNYARQKRNIGLSQNPHDLSEYSNPRDDVACSNPTQDKVILTIDRE